MTITYHEIEDRCADLAQKVMPDLPESDTIEAWTTYAEELNTTDIYDLAQEQVDSLDWVIYTHYGLEIHNAAYSGDWEEAESQWSEMSNEVPDSVARMASQVAFFLLFNKVLEKLDALVDESKATAEEKIEGLENDA